MVLPGPQPDAEADADILAGVATWQHAGAATRGHRQGQGRGKFKGRKRKPELMPEKIKTRLAAGETRAQIAKSLKVARSSVYRVVAGPRAA
jgi:DNA invertase Pin-like site-specific DNA recombinase